MYLSVGSGGCKGGTDWLIRGEGGGAGAGAGAGAAFGNGSGAGSGYGEGNSGGALARWNPSAVDGTVAPLPCESPGGSSSPVPVWAVGLPMVNCCGGLG